MTSPTAPGGWFYGIGGEKHGPISLGELQGLVRGGQVGPQMMVWAEGMPSWVPAGSLPVLYPRGNDAALGLLIPIGPQSGLSIAAGYCGLLGIIPLVGPVGVVLGIFGLLDLKKHPEKKGWGRAITGIVAGSLFTICYAFAFLGH